MKITRNGSQPSTLGPPDSFTGHVMRTPILTGAAPSRLATGWVTFDPGARTTWHTHPVGQLLVITAGAGCVQKWGEPVEKVFAGDIVWFEAGEKHWHGAAPSTSMTHIAVTEAENGSAVTWLEPVTDAQYAGAKA